MILTRFSLTITSFLLLALSASAENWPHWRGPYFNGSTTEKDLPVKFSKTENIKWTAELPGPSAATPIIWEDHVFLSSTDEKNKTLQALALDRKNGQLRWNHQVSPGFNQDNYSNFASPSPATDGKTVVFLYGNGEMAAFDFAGKKLWSRSLQKDYGQFAYQWTYGASPTFYEGKLFLQVLHRNEPVHGRGVVDGKSYLLALEPATGKTIWKHDRPNEARSESQEAYSTPIPFEYKGRKELLITGGDCITGHSIEDGAEYWRWGTWNPTRIGHWRLVPSAVSGGGVVLACGPKGSPVFACKAGAKGTQDDSGVAWKSTAKEVSTDVATPLFYKDRFYILRGENRNFSRVEPATGKVDWTGELENRPKIEASPTAADDKIYFQNFKGEVFVVAASGDQFKLLNTIPMGDEGDDRLRASIPISQGNLFIRTGRKLYCVGK